MPRTRRAPELTPKRRLDPAFERACEARGVAAADRPALQALLDAWRKEDQPDAERHAELLDDYSHWQLYVRSRDGDDAAAREFERYWRRYIGAFLKARGDAHRADDIASAFFVRVYRLVGAVHPWQCPFLAYLRAVLINLHRDEARRLGRQRARELPLEDHEAAVDAARASASPGADRSLLEGERLAALDRALARLPPTDHFLLRQVALEERPGPEVAAELGIALPALWKRVERAKKRLRALLAAEGFGQADRTGRSGEKGLNGRSRGGSSAGRRP